MHRPTGRLRTPVFLMLWVMMALVPAAAVTAPTPYTRSLTFADMGLVEPLKLMGVDSEVSLPFGIRLDEAVVGAKLELGIDFSPALISRLSHIVVRLNGEIVQTLPIDGTQAALALRKVLEVDPRLFTDYNQLSLQFVGHYTLGCEDSSHSSLWVQFALDSALRLTMLPLEQRAGLGALPAPFFDQRDNRQLILPFVFARRPAPDIVAAAGVLASWFGKLADYRGARFPVVIDQWPEQHAVLLMTNADMPQWLDLKPTEEARVYVLRHPERPYNNLLVLHGRDAVQLRKAVLGTVFGSALLSGNRATIESVVEPPERAIYDVPRWIRTDRKVRFDELVDSPMALQVKGNRPLPIRINARIPPDLYTGYERVIDLDLRYRYSKPLQTDNSNLAVFINERFVQSIRLESEEKGQEFELRVPVADAKRYQFQSALEIPAIQIESNNQMQFQFSLDYHNIELCKDTPGADVHAALDPDSTVDLTGFSHYADMPNLALFANAGYPFTRHADLSRTTLVLPDGYSESAIEAGLALLGRMASQTGVTASRFRVETPSTLSDVARDLLLVGVDSLSAPADAAVPLLLRDARRVLRASKSPLGELAPVDVQVEAAGAMGGVVGYESPLSEGQSVIAVLGSNNDSLQWAVNALHDPARRDRVRGAAVVIDEDSIRVVDSETTYTLGTLGWKDKLRIFMARFPALLSVLAVLAAALLAIVSFLALRRAATRRLEN